MSEANDEWEFYPCWVDDGPASIVVDLGLAGRPRPEGVDTIYVSLIDMLDADEHGMGSPQEAEALYELEDRIVAGGLDLGLTYVARLRNKGVWQITFMGPAGREPELDRISRAAIEGACRSFRVASKPDVEWSYVDTFLLPDDERYQWIQDRRVVDVLEREGDSLTEPRRVDHWVTFGTEDGRAAFAGAVRGLGFELVEAPGDEEGEDGRAFGATFHRVDSVQLDDIHELAMILHGLAEQHGGEYDGWETQVVR